MSININVHGNTISRLMLIDPERYRREELQRRKLLRLEQVRQQSKDIASQLRQRVSEERKRQVDRIDQIKADEVRAWKQKHLGIMDDILEECVGKVGEAQAAAKAEIELEKKRLEQQKVNRRLAAKRGREAMARLESDKMKQAKPTRKPLVTTKRPVSGKLGETVNVATQVSDSINDMQTPTHLNQIVGNNTPQVIPATQNISSDTLSSSIEVAIQSLQLAQAQSINKFSNNSERVLPVNTDQPWDEIPIPVTTSERQNPQNDQITLASDLISKRRQTNSNIGPLLGFSEMPREINEMQDNYRNRNASSNRNTPQVFAKDIQPTIASSRLQTISNRKTDSTQSKHRTLSPSKHSTQQPHQPKQSTQLPDRPTFVPMFTKPPSTQLLVQGTSIHPGGVTRNSTSATQIVPTQSSSSLLSAPKVKYYDHANRFSKEYEANDEHLIVHSEANDSFVPNAMEAAAIERRHEEQFAVEKQINRQKAAQRGQVALERERVRKDYDLMSEQLEQLSTQHEYAKKISQPNHDYTEERLKQMAKDRQNAMNKLVEDVLPPRVLITCPRISQAKSDEAVVNVADLERSDKPNVFQPQSDDSCASIILGEIANKPKQKQQKQQTTKTAQNNARPLVLDKENDNFAQLAEERKQIEKRERDVKHKERKLEEKLLKMFQETQQKSHKSAATSVRVQTDKCLEKDVRIVQADTPDAPVQIIIQVNGGNQRTTETSSGINQPKSLNPKKVAPLRTTPSQVFPKTPMKAMVPETITVADGSSTSTAYQSLPKDIRTQLSDVLTHKEQTDPKARKEKQKTSVASSTLQQYIRRLLGMSRASIDQLEVSDVSTISTPGSSLINISTNITQTSHDEPITDQQINKLKTFIKDNHNFISDLEKSLREISMGSDETSNLKAVETVWMETLTKKEQEMKFVKNGTKKVSTDASQPQKTIETVPAAIKPILKKPTSPKKVQVVESESRVNLGKGKKVVHSEKIESETQRCNQRIADLNEMIVKVRREKQRLLENTYSSMGSSVSDHAQNSTEYLEIARKVLSEGSNNSSRTTTDLPSLSEERQLEAYSLAASKQIGISRDSGLGGVSRPVTASDAPVNSPDHRPTATSTDDETEHTNGKNDHIQGQSKYVLSTSETIETNTHKRKPPSSLQRFGPQIEPLELGHDLSTIIEVDTPIATSRLNTSQNDANKNTSTEQNSSKLHQLLLEISSNTRNNLKIASYPIDSNHPIQIQPFPSHSSYADAVSDIVDTISITGEQHTQLFTDPTNIRPHITHQQFAKDISGLCTSQSVAGALDDDPNSFPDVEAELRKRNLLQHSTESVFLDTNAEELKQIEPKRATANKLPTYSTSSSDNLEQEMQKLGLNWASSMIKKNKIASTQALTTSSSSSNDDHLIEQLKSFNHKSNLTNIGNSSANVSDKSPGKPLNLKEFLARELLKRNNSLSPSTVHEDSTLASQFLRSLLGTSSDNSSKLSVGLVYTSERHRTSTPVKDVRPSTPGRPPMIPVEETETSRSKSGVYHMFSGESGLSSVRGSTITSTDKENTTSRDASTNGSSSKNPESAVGKRD